MERDLQGGGVESGYSTKRWRQGRKGRVKNRWSGWEVGRMGRMTGREGGGKEG